MDVILTPPADFRDNYLTKNGDIADAATLNAAPDILKIELDTLWKYITQGSDIIDNTTYFVDDIISQNDPEASKKVRSITGMNNYVFNGGTWS
jgi:hypothetical protein